MPDIEVVEVHYDSPEYRSEVELRFRVLREPLGLSFTKEQLDAECTDIHIVARSDGEIVGCLVLTPMGPDTFQMRQVAVDPTLQKQGIGKRLVEFSEKVAKERRIREMMLHAREEAVAFYIPLGYKIRGEPFIEVSIPHREMFKIIRP